MPTDHEFITPSEKTQCQVHLTSETVQGDLPQCSHTKESRVKRHVPTLGTSETSFDTKLAPIGSSSTPSQRDLLP